MPVVQIQMKMVYGNMLYYPCPGNIAAEALARIAGKKSFSKADIANIKAIGFDVQYVNAYEAEEV